MSHEPPPKSIFPDFQGESTSIMIHNEKNEIFDVQTQATKGKKMMLAYKIVVIYGEDERGEKIRLHVHVFTLTGKIIDTTNETESFESSMISVAKPTKILHGL